MHYAGGNRVRILWQLSRRKFLEILTGNGLAGALLFRSAMRGSYGSRKASTIVPRPSGQDSRVSIVDGWRVQSSASVRTSGEVISKERFDPADWYPAKVPSTVLAVLVDNKVYPDPYFGMNLRSIPGTTYPIGSKFANLPMPSDSPFRVSWWYRSELSIPAGYEGKHIWLNFCGINYRANIWMNGRQIADASQVAGAFRYYEFDVTGIARPGAGNVVAVEVFAPHADDLGINWVDVNPTPPDKNMGLWGEAFISASGPVALRYPQVVTHVDVPSLAVAHLVVNADLHNATGAAVKGTLDGQIEGIHFEQEVEVPPRSWKRVSFTPEEFPQLNISHPRLWWPWQLGAQETHELKIEFKTGGRVSDSQKVRFGIREITSKLTAEGYRLFRVNGKKILIRGAGWWGDDMLLRVFPEKIEAGIAYAKDMHLNCLRMDGKFGDDQLLDLADRLGILLMPGWCCCDHWERWKSWKTEDYTVAAASLRDRIRWFRNHPSVMCWLNGDDNPPPEKPARMYVNVLKDENWPNPVLASATGKPAAVTGKTGVKMSGPYDYVPPDYWLLDKENGGAFGFLTETSPGAAIPPIENLRKFIPPDHLWPIDDYWNFHTGGGVFGNIKVYTQALNARYGEAADAEDFAKKAQLMDYEGQRAMFEAYGRNKYLSTGVLQEMLNSAWPSLIWTLYDYYLRPAGGYFGTKKACEPLHIQFSYDDRSVVVVNSYYRGFKGMSVRVNVFNIDLSEKFSKQLKVDLAPDSSTMVLTIPFIDGLSTTYFIRLSLGDAEGRPVSRNFYWLSTKPDVLEWEKTVWYYTPTKSFADLTALSSLPAVELKGSSSTKIYGNKAVSRVTIENPTNHLAFFTNLQVTKGKGKDSVVPIFWEDNYFELMPGEKREIKAAYKAKCIQNIAPVIAIRGWNVVSTFC